MDTNIGYPSFFTRYLGPEWPTYKSKVFSTSYLPASGSSSGKGAGGKGGPGPKLGQR